MFAASESAGRPSDARRLSTAWFVSMLTMLAPFAVCAQPAPVAAPRSPRVEVRVGGAWGAGLDLGSRDAVLTPNGLPTGGTGSPLFSTSTELAGAPALDARLGFVVAPSWRLVAGVSYGRPELRTTITGDLELETPATASDRISEYIVDGSVVWSPTTWRFAGGRGAPFVLGGAGYLRQLMSDRAVVETGQTYHVGGGAAWGLGRGAGTAPRWGVDVELRVTWRVGGVDVEDKVRVGPRFGGGAFVRF